MTDSPARTPPPAPSGDPFTIPQVTVLTGHTSADTAYHVSDHPYGGGLRCQVRYWIETRRALTNYGDQRFVSQTTNPRAAATDDGPAWNNPHRSTYDTLMSMYLDDQHRVRPYGVPYWITGPFDTRIRAMGIYASFTRNERARYDSQLSVSRTVNVSEWADWSETITALAGHIATTGTDPDVVDGKWWQRSERRYYLLDPPAYVTAARVLANPT